MRRLCVAILLCALPAYGQKDPAPPPAPKGSTAAPASAAADDAPAMSARAERPKGPLPPLPKPPSLELPPPDPASVATLDALLGRLVAKDRAVRDTAVSEILEVEADALPAIRRRLVALAESSSKEQMKELLGQIRDKARDGVREKNREEGREEKTKTPDYLEMLEARALPDSRTWIDLVSVVSLSRMLQQIGNVQAARELVGVYARFGEFLRVDTQLGLEKMGEKAVAALIEAERHPAPKVASWATRQLDALGKGIPGEAVQTQDPEALADILRAYGRARDPDAARLVISFANSERTQIRDAARQAVALMGEVSNWQLRDTYENVVGKKPPREWSWERTARELFGEFDRLRLSETAALFEHGLEAEKSGKLDEAVAAYDEVLAHSPSLERGSEMVPGYMAYARAHLESDTAKASLALRRAARLAPRDAPDGKAAESLLLTLEAEDLYARGVADQALVKRAQELDPSNTRASRLFSRMDQADALRDERVARLRYFVAGALGLVALGAVAFLVLRKKAPVEPSSETPPPEPVPAPDPMPIEEPEPEPIPAVESDKTTTDRPPKEDDPSLH
jgi:hypothetical protein